VAVSFTKDEILGQLDKCASDFTFPVLDNGYVYPVDVRLTAFRDDDRWAIALEAIGFNPRSGGHNGINNCLHLFGNCLRRPPGTANEDFIGFTSSGPDGPTFDDEVEEFVRPEARSLRIRQAVARFNLSPETFAAHGIELQEPPTVLAHELLRLLVPQHRDLVLLADAELQERLPPDLRRILRLNEWHHPDVSGGELPSNVETFQLLADVLVTGDAGKYEPTERPNTHWRNWPDGGTL
jgi:hypothetical protein